MKVGVAARGRTANYHASGGHQLGRDVPVQETSPGGDAKAPTGSHQGTGDVAVHGDAPVAEATGPPAAAEPPKQPPVATGNDPKAGASRKPAGDIDPARRAAAEKNLAAHEADLAKEKQWQSRADAQPIDIDPAKVKKPPLPRDIEQDLKKLPPLSEPDERAEQLRAMLKRPGLEPAVVKYLKALEAVAESQARKGAQAASAQRKGNLDTQVQHYQKELAEASKTANEILSARGPNYNAKTTATPFDQVMGEELWKALLAELKKAGKNWPKLHPDHFYPTSRIAKSAAMTRWMEVYAKASAAEKELMRKGLKNIGDLPDNLFSMRGDANTEWKKDQLWSELSPAGGVKYGYTEPQVRAMKDRETEIVKKVDAAIQAEVEKYKH
jgi:hypothetical protein